MRSKNSIINAKFNLIFTFISIILSFISRSIFIKILGIQFVGINTMLLNILGIINLVDLGIDSAITFSLYEPLNNNNKTKISEIMLLFKKVYEIVGILVLILGVIASLFLKFFIKTNISIKIIYLAYFLYLINALMTYFFTYKYILIKADQKNFEVTKINGIIKTIKVLIQISFLIFLKNFIIWLIIEICFNAITIVFTNKRIKEIYGTNYFSSSKSFIELLKKYSLIVKNTKNIFFHKIGSFIVYQTDTFMISILFNISEVGIYSNYMMIVNNLLNLFGQVFLAVTASLGSLVAEKNNKKSFMVWNELYSFEIFSASIIAFCTYKLLNPFISLWVGKELALNNDIIFILSINLYIFLSRNSLQEFKLVYGIFWDIYSPIIEGIINLVFSIILSKKFGIIGIFLGTLMSNIIIVLGWIPYTVFKYGFRESISLYIKIYIKYFIMALSPLIIVNKFINNIVIFTNINNFYKLIIIGILILLVTFSTELIIFIFDNNFRKFLKRVRSAIK